MPDESCRKCGGPLVDSKRCPTCNKTFSWICTVCNQKTLDQIHFSCQNLVSEQKYTQTKFYRFNVAALG